MVKKTKEDTIHEFFSQAKIYDSGYESIALQIINEIYSWGYTLALDYAVDESRINWTTKTVWLRIKPNTKPLHYIWNLLHEYGHYISGEQPVGFIELDKLGREEEAWDNALKEMYKRFPQLLNELDDFQNHKEVCLTTHRNYHNDLKRRLGLS